MVWKWKAERPEPALAAAAAAAAAATAASGDAASSSCRAVRRWRDAEGRMDGQDSARRELGVAEAAVA